MKENKSGARVEIPILPELAAVLKKARASGGESADEYVWPALAKDYGRYRQHISALIGIVFMRARIERQTDRPDGKRRANVAGCHALRTTWITRALSADVPTELVRRVSGHSGVEVVLKQTFQPSRAEMQDAILKAFNPPPTKKMGKAKRKE